MDQPSVLVFHRPAADDDPPLVRLLAAARARLVEAQTTLFRLAGAADVRVHVERRAGSSFGRTLGELAPSTGGLVVLGSGAVARLNATDAGRLVAVAGSGQRRALTNNRHSSDICAIGEAAVLRDVPDLPADNALPRWLEEHAGFSVTELPGRQRLGLDLDTPLDVALAAHAPGAAGWLRDLVDRGRLSIPRHEDVRRLAADPHRELLVFGRSSSDTLRWLERHARCRVRFLAEERGLRASTPLAIGARPAPATARPPRATLGRLLAERGPAALAGIVAELADGAILDTRVLLADHLGPDEGTWPSDSDRFASDLHRAGEVDDPWLRALTASAAGSELPILLGAHTLVGPGVRIVLGRAPPGGRSGASGGGGLHARLT